MKMKKLLAILCSVAIILSCSAVSFVALAGETQAEERFLYSFSTKEEYEANKNFVNNAGTNISLAYDEAEGALKAYPTTPGVGNHQVRFSPSQGATTVKVDEYPVIALKVKFNNTGNPAFGGINAGTNKNSRPSGNTSSSVYSNAFLAGVGKTGQWQLIVYDGTKKVWSATNTTGSTTYCGTWEGLIFMLTANNATTTADDVCWIEWAGTFKTIQDVYAYEEEMATPYLYNFKDEAATQKLLSAQNKRVTSGANTTLSYDAEKKALKIDAKDGATSAGQFQPIADSPFTTMATSYPVIAFKIKVNNTANKFNELFIGTEKASRAVSSGNYNNSLGVISDAPTGDWQVVIIDGRKLAYDPNNSATKTWFDGTYGNMIVKLMADNVTATADDIWWVEWFGAFETVEDACAYGEIQTPFLYNFSEEDDATAYINNGKIGAGDCQNTTVAYDAAEGAIKISPKDLTKVDASRFEIRANDSSRIEVKDYPVIAIKIKTKNTTRPFGGIWPGTANNGSTSKYKAKDVCPSYSRTGDWELLLYDGTNSTDTYYSGQWHGLLVRLMANNVTPTADDVCWIEWAGVFKTAAEAEQYYIKSFGLDGAETSEIGDGSGKEDPSGFFYNFTDRATTQSMIKGSGGKYLIHNGGGGNTVFSYDPVKRALKISPQDFAKGQAARLAIEANNATTNTADYPIYAVKIKVNTKNNGLAGMWAGTQNSGEKTTYSGPDLLNQTTHATTGDWQLIILDNTGNKGFKGQWKAMLFRLLTDAELPTQSDAFWIQWAGAFKSIDDVYAYADMQKPTEEEDKTPEFFYDFSNKVDTNVWLGNKIIFAEGGSNTTLSYDETEKALKLGAADTKNTKAGRVSILANGTAAVKEYPVMAVMVKLNNPDRALGGLLPGTDRPDGGSKFMISNVLKNYKHNNEWQLLVFDGTKFDNKYYTGNWDGFLLRLLGENAIPTEKDYLFIKWAGAFKTAKDAYAYAGMEVPPAYVDPNPSPFFYNFTESFNTTGWIENGDVAADGSSNTKVSYDKTEKALKVEPKNYKDKNAGVVAMYARGEAVNVADYPVFAMKVKTKNVSSILNSVWAGTNSKYPTKFRVQLPIEQYNATDEWQYMIIDATGYEAYDDAYTGTWFGLITKLMDVNLVPTKDDVFYIQWAGVFATADEAYAYAGIENPKKNTSSDPDGKAPTEFFWDLSKGDVINNHVSVVGDTKFEYDFSTNAMKVTITDTNDDNAVTATPGRVILGDKIPVKSEVKATDYPFIALRVKLSKDSLTGGWAHYRTTYSLEKYLAADIDSSDCQVKLLGYNPTSEWQTIIIDCTADPTAAFFFDGNWSALKFDLISAATAQEGDTVYVKWAGAFKSEKDIEDYVKLTEGDNDEPEKTDDTDVDEKGKLSGVVIAIIVVAAVLVIAGGAVAGVIIFKKKRS